MLQEDKKLEIINTLSKRITNIRCPMCNGDKFTLADSYIRLDLQDSLNSISIGGPAIATTAIICNKCGYVSLHALGILGFLSTEKKEDSENGKK